jgi:hypothetical protein
MTIGFYLGMPEVTEENISSHNFNPVLVAVASGLDAAAEDWDTTELDIRLLHKAIEESDRYISKQNPQTRVWGVVDKGPAGGRNDVIMITGSDRATASRVATFLQQTWEKIRDIS